MQGDAIRNQELPPIPAKTHLFCEVSTKGSIASQDSHTSLRPSAQRHQPTESILHLYKIFHSSLIGSWAAHKAKHIVTDFKGSHRLIVPTPFRSTKFKSPLLRLQIISALSCLMTDGRGTNSQWQGHPWAGGSGCYKKAIWANQVSQ